MHGREVEIRKRLLHMRSGSTAAVAVDWNGSSAGSLVKDLQKINVGDCALFKPPHDYPPFIGLIRSLSPEKDSNLRLGVNWLYRPADLKLGKDVAIEAAPNEVFYSFHRDEIPAASLLHRCKVAFLPKGVELPSGVSSFVCRRVYDITNRRLWWLTDRNYVNDWQEEIDRLLHRTRLEMHATVQPQQGGRSPKPVNGPMSTAQLKNSADSTHSAHSFPSQAKGKKRERVDQVSEPLKPERSSRIDDGDSVYLKSESIIKSEISKITERGGLVDSDSVERLVQLMQSEKTERKVDLISRSLLAGVIAATDKDDYLNRFVQLKGLPVLDEWLQEVHRGKIGDSSSPKETDRSVEDFLLILLRALDKLPVNLNALQTCHIGKSVNHLRSHRNADIQKKARSLVDTWKKRVEAEMKTHDAKSGSSQAVPWPGRTRHEVSHGGNWHPAGPSDASMKGSLLQLSSSKSAPVKIVQGEITAKSASASASPGASKLAPSSAFTGREGQHRMSVVGGSPELPQTAARDERSSSSSQSHTSQYSSDHAKNLTPSGREDARSSTAGSASASKVTGNSSRHQRSPNGLQGSAASGIQKEAGSSRNSSLTRSSPSEKLSRCTVAGEKTVDAPVVDSNNHKLIVKIPHRSPAQSASGGSGEDLPFMNSRASSPVLSEKQDHTDDSLKRRNDAYHISTVAGVNTEISQSNDFKDVLSQSERDGSPAAVSDGRCWTGDESGRLADIPNAAASAAKNDMKSRKSLDSCFSSINALIESCAKYSEVNATMSGGDDLGMNLLASVAAGEISNSSMVSPADSPQRNAAAVEASRDDHYKSKPLHGDNFVEDQRQIHDSSGGDAKKQNVVTGTSQTSDEGLTQQCGMPGKTLLGKGDICPRSDEIVVCVTALPAPERAMDKSRAGEELPREKEAAVKEESHDHVLDKICSANGCLATEGQVNDASFKEEQQIRPDNAATCTSAGVSGENNTNLVDSSALVDHKPPFVAAISESMTNNVLAKAPSQSGKDFSLEKMDMKGDSIDTHEGNEASTSPHKPDLADQKTKGNEVLGSKGAIVSGSDPPSSQIEPPVSAVYVKDQRLEYKGSKLAAVEGDEIKERVSMSANASSSAAGSSAVEGKLEFDLNEGFNVDDGKYGEPASMAAPGGPGSVRFVSPFPPFSVGSASVGPAASITIAAPAKGPFLRPEDLLRNKQELGWKGSAATSAFRRAEPRKIPEMPASSSGLDATSGKQARAPLEFDLNVADERILEDLGCRNSSEVELANKNDHALTDGQTGMRFSGGLDLDLNRVDEAPELGQPLANSVCRLEIPLPPAKLTSSGRLSNGEASARMEFDLNDGPTIDEVEPSSYNRQHTHLNIRPPPSLGLGVNGADIANLSSWYPPGGTFSAVPLPDRGDQPFPNVGTASGPPRILAGSTGNIPFNTNVYRGSVLSSPGVPFPTTSFQYSVFPFGTSFPLPSSSLPGGSTAFMDLSSAGRLCIPAAPSQLLGTSAASVSTQYSRPYLMPLPDVGNNVVDNSRRWGRQGLDLNAGPGGLDVEGRDQTLPVLPRQVSAVSPLGLAGGVLKRKEPDGGWDPDRISYKHPSWQ